MKIIPSAIKSLGCLIGTSFLASTLAHANITFTVSDVGPALNSATPPTTNLFGASVTSSIAPAPGPITYTLTDVDLTSFGGTPSETMVLQVAFSVSTGSVAYNTIPNGNVYNGGGTLGNQIEPGEDLIAVVSLVSSSYSMSPIDVKFTSTTVGGSGTGESWSIVTEHDTYPRAHPNQVFALPQPSIFWSIEDVASTVANAGINLQGYTIQIVVETPASPSVVWTGSAGNAWSTAGNWDTNSPPTTGERALFGDLSTANLATTLNQDFNIAGIAVDNPAGPVSVSGSNILTLQGDGIDLSAAIHDLTISTPIVAGTAQNWTVPGDRVLRISGPISGTPTITLQGNGRVALGASNLLPSGLSDSDLVVNGTIDLNGFTQAVKSLVGSGNYQNSVGAATLTVGLEDSATNFAGRLKDDGGTLAVVKVGSGNLLLSGSSDHSGGFTNNGTGFVQPRNGSAFGSGPVVMNGGTIYSAGFHTFSNSLALNGATLRIGGGNNNTVTWTGPVVVTGTSGVFADGGTAGVTVSGNVDISGATFTSNGSTNSILGEVSGAGGNLTVNNGVLQLAGANTYNGTTTIESGTLRLQPTGTISNNSNVVINSAGIFNIRNTEGWVYTGTISGTDSGTVSLNSGTNTTLAGTISGVAAVTANNAGTDALVSGAIGGFASVTVQAGVDENGNGAILRLSGANTYAGSTTIIRGQLVLAANQVLPDTSSITIGNGTLNVGSSTETTGTLAVDNSATIQLGAGGTIAFANSSAMDWSNGSLNITGNFIPGASIRFGVNNSGLTSAQLLAITSPGLSSFSLTNDGFLTATVADSNYETWAMQIPNPAQRGRDDDPDGDGFTNFQEFLFGTSPNVRSGSLVTSSKSGNNLVLRWLQLENGATYSLWQSANLTAASWSQNLTAIAFQDGNQTGAPLGYQYFTVSIPITASKMFFRIEGSR